MFSLRARALLSLTAGAAAAVGAAVSSAGCHDYASTTPAVLHEGDYIIWTTPPLRSVGPSELAAGIRVEVRARDGENWPAEVPRGTGVEVVELTEWIAVFSATEIDVCVADERPDDQPAVAEMRVRVTPPGGEEREVGVVDILGREVQESFPRARIGPRGVRVSLPTALFGGGTLTAEETGSVRIAPVVWGQPDRGSLAGPEGKKSYYLVVGLCSAFPGRGRPY